VHPIWYTILYPIEYTRDCTTRWALGPTLVSVCIEPCTNAERDWPPIIRCLWSMVGLDVSTWLAKSMTSVESALCMFPRSQTMVTVTSATTKAFAPCEPIVLLVTKRWGSRAVLPSPVTVRNAALAPETLVPHEQRSFRGGWLDGTQRHHSDPWRHDNMRRRRRRLVERDRRRIIDPKRGRIIRNDDAEIISTWGISVYLKNGRTYNVYDPKRPPPTRGFFALSRPAVINND
jgi:hypothetical protein